MGNETTSYRASRDAVTMLTIPPPPPGSRVSGSEKPYKDKTFTKPSYKTFRDCPRIESDILEKFQSRFEEITASSCLKEDEPVKPRTRKAPRRIPKSVRRVYLSLESLEYQTLEHQQHRYNMQSCKTFPINSSPFE